MKKKSKNTHGFLSAIQERPEAVWETMGIILILHLGDGSTVLFIVGSSVFV